MKKAAIVSGLLFVAIPQQAMTEEIASEAASGESGNVTIIRQSGAGNNVIKITQSGDGNVADVYQNGEHNETDVTQEGGQNRLDITQTGRDNNHKTSPTGKSYTTINQNGKITSYDEQGEVVKTH